MKLGYDIARTRADEEGAGEQWLLPPVSILGTHPGAIGASGSSFWGTQGEALGHLDVIVDFAE